MTEENPLPEHTASPKPEESVAAATEAVSNEEPATGRNNSIAAALSALSSAAAPVREEDESISAPAPEDESISFAPASIPETSSATVPPPPPAPQDAETYPAPTEAPIAVPVMIAAPAAPATSAVVPPTPTTRRKKWPWILAICIAAAVLLLGGMAACTSAVLNAAIDAIEFNQSHRNHGYDYDDLFDPGYRGNLYNFYYSADDESFERLLNAFDIEEGAMEADGSCPEGAYRVGGENGIEPGLYYLEGSEEGVSHFYVFHSDAEANVPRYRSDSSVASLGIEYFGNYYADLRDGDAIVFIPFDEDDVFHTASGPMETMPPYESGCYRVGIDIPPGTYTITCQAEAARLTDSEAGAFIMDNVEFDGDFILDSAYVIQGGRQTITVEDGQYLELFAAIATPATASTKVPLQHIESEAAHAA